MKTILHSLAVIAVSFFIVSAASAQYGRSPYHTPYDGGYHEVRMQSFYYYPKSNVYYNQAADRYIFLNRNAWVVSDRLPHYYRIRKEPRFVVYHNGFDVWNDNRSHCAKYNDYRRVAPDIAYDRNYPYDGYHNYPDRRNDWKK